ncbi:leucine-rich repeat-containing protein 15 [Anguilla rostrata]|uniref:leucine-rich repeat-containing protein 15 n=1 Tax=Anguilla rostrata TaxID=7938 RepID=UPI0030D1A404
MRFFALVLFLGELLSSATCCPAGCDCGNEEVVECGADVTDVPSPVSPRTILLRLAGTRIAELGEGSFRDMPALLGIDLNCSRVRTVHPAAFGAVPRLRSLKLSSNRLSCLPARAFANLTGLRQLFLSGNELEAIPPGLFDALAELTVLDLSGNRLAHLDEDVFRNLGNLVQLDLGKNSLRQLPASVFSRLAKLTHLRLYYNQLESVRPGTFDNIKDILELELFNNQISRLSPRLFWNMPNLVKLTLSRNRLQTIPAQSFYYLPNITFLSFYKNPLTFLPDQLIGHMPSLKKFYLYETELDTLPENLFCNMTTLEMLSVTFNSRLRHLPKDIFSCLSGLYRLKLAANSLEFLHTDQFSGLINLETLILNSNQLRSLPPDVFRNVPKLANLSLEHNRLETLPGGVLSTAAGLRMVTLKDNPWQCTCDILDFAQWVGRMRTVVEDYDRVACHAPPRLRNTSLGSLSAELVRCWVTPTADFTGNVSHPTITLKASTTEDDPVAKIGPINHTAVTRKASPTEGNPTAESGPSEDSSGPPSWYDLTKGAASAARPTAQTAARQTRSSPSTAALPRTSTEDRPLEDGLGKESQAFYEVVVLQPEYSIVHNNRLNGWVYLWTLPPSGPYITFLVVFHVLLVATCVALIAGSLWVLYRLNQAMERVAEGTVREKKNRSASGRK